MIMDDVRYFEYIPEANASIRLAIKRDVLVKDEEYLAIAKRGRQASILNGTSSNRARIHGNIAEFEYDKIILTVRHIINKDDTPEVETLFAWLAKEFPSAQYAFKDKEIKSIDARQLSFIQRSYTITLTEVDAMKFRLMFPHSPA